MQKPIVFFLLLLTFYSYAQKKQTKNIGRTNPSIQLAAGASFSCALVEGQLWCWGLNSCISPDSVNSIFSPMKIAPDKKLKAISCDQEDIVALDEKGTAWGWGYGNWFYSQDHNTVLSKVYDKKIFPVKLFDSIQWTKIDIANYHFVGLKQDGTLWIVGRDECQTFGDSYYQLPQQIAKEHKWIGVGLGYQHGVVMDDDHALWTWGNNFFSQLGLGRMRTSRLDQDCTSLQPLNAGKDWKMIDVSTTNTIAIREDGSLWFWGDRGYALFERDFVLTPTRIGVDAIWIAASTYQMHTLAVQKDGSLWAIGRNAHGELGDGTTTRRTELVRIGKDNDWVLVKAGLNFSMAVKKNGTIWTWGLNDHGQLGDGTTIDRYFPQQVHLK